MPTIPNAIRKFPGFGHVSWRCQPGCLRCALGAGVFLYASCPLMLAVVILVAFWVTQEIHKKYFFLYILIHQILRYYNRVEHLNSLFPDVPSKETVWHYFRACSVSATLEYFPQQMASNCFESVSNCNQGHQLCFGAAFYLCHAEISEITIFSLLSEVNRIFLT